MSKRFAAGELDFPVPWERVEGFDEPWQIRRPLSAVFYETLRTIATSIVARRVHIPRYDALQRVDGGAQETAPEPMPSIMPRFAGTVQGHMSYGQGDGALNGVTPS